MTASPDSFLGPINKKLNGVVSDWQVANHTQELSRKFPQLPK